MKHRIATALVVTGLGLATQVLAVATAAAQTYPHKPIRMIVPFPPGGGTDITARHMAQKLSEGLGQQVIVDNRPGAGGTLGADIAAAAAPDGYTLAMVSASYAVNPSLYKVKFDHVKDIAPVSVIGSSAIMIVVHPGVPARSLRELVAHARANPGKLNYGSTGHGGITHLASEYFKLAAGVDITHVPYKGTGPALTDLLGGQIQVMCAAILAALPQSRSGKLRALAVSTATRSAAAPDVPTVAEAGVPDYVVALWYGIWGPGRMAPAIVERLNAEVRRAVLAPDMKDKLAAEGLEAAPNGSAEFRAHIDAEIKKWARVVKAAGIKAS